MTVKIENGNLIITIPVDSNPPLSSTGKTKLVANSHGYQHTTAVVDGKPVSVTVTAIIKAN